MPATQHTTAISLLVSPSKQPFQKHCLWFKDKNPEAPRTKEIFPKRRVLRGWTHPYTPVTEASAQGRACGWDLSSCGWVRVSEWAGVGWACGPQAGGLGGWRAGEGGVPGASSGEESAGSHVRCADTTCVQDHWTSDQGLCQWGQAGSERVMETIILTVRTTVTTADTSWGWATAGPAGGPDRVLINLMLASPCDRWRNGGSEGFVTWNWLRSGLGESEE